jgi:hypothetical protein
VGDNKSLTDRKFKITLGNGEIINIGYEIARSNYSPNNTEIQDAKTHNATIYGFDVTNTISNATNRVNSTMIYYVPFDKLPVEVVTALENDQLTKLATPPSTLPASLNKFSEFTLNPTSVSAVFNPVSAIRNNLIYVQENPGTSSEPPSQPLTNKEGWALFKTVWDYSTDTLDVIKELGEASEGGLKELGEIAEEGTLVADFLLTLPDLLMLVNDANKDIAELDRFLELVNNPDCNIDAKTIQQLSDKIKALQLDTKTLGTMLGLYSLVSIPAPPFLGQVLDIALDDVKEGLRELYQQEIQLLKKFETPNKYGGKLEFNAKTDTDYETAESTHKIEFTLDLNEKSHVNPATAAQYIVQAPSLATGDGTISGKVEEKVIPFHKYLPVEASFKVDVKGEYNPDSKQLKLGILPPAAHQITIIGGKYCGEACLVWETATQPTFIDNLAVYSITKPFRINLNEVNEKGAIVLRGTDTIAYTTYDYNLVLEPKCHLPKAPAEPKTWDVSPLSPVKPSPINGPPPLPEFQPPAKPDSQSPTNPTPNNEPEQLPKFQPPLKPSQKDPHPKLPQFPTIP